MSKLAAHTEDIIASGILPNTPLEGLEHVEPFLNLTREQSQVLLSLYRVVHPELVAKVPALFSEMSRKLNEDRKERNSTVAKLQHAPEQYAQEVLALQEVQKAVSDALIQSDMDVEKARASLQLKPKDTPKDQLSNKELLSNGFLLGGIRDTTTTDSTKKSSPLSAPGFREAKTFYDYLFDERKFSMAAVQVGSFYAQEARDCHGENCQEGEDPDQVSIEYFEKAARLGNPMAMHKAGWHYDQKGEFQEAIAWYTKAADEGYPDSAHNLGRIYQEGTPKARQKIDIDLPKAIAFFDRGLQYGYTPSGTQLGRIFFMLSTDKPYRVHLPQSDPNFSRDPQEYMETAISYFNKANHLLDVDSMQFLGMIYGSKEFGRYDLERAQNLFELALMVSQGGQQHYEYLCRTLNARKAMIYVMEERGGIPQEPQEVSTEGIKTCAARACDKKEKTKNQFQRCGGCKRRYYCSRECQVNDWKNGHKTACRR
ncbi:MAG: hypothetical protein J3Q66DRAFT_435097 [Benniella sp.]|nr:MAG: hypothetical protein J3Q66DRAFT_435097 [Benniella sp.]